MSAWEEYKKNLGEVRPWDILKPSTEWLSDEESGERYKICGSCDFFNQVSKQCKKCGCFMGVKTRLSLSTCPVGKW